MQSINTQMKKLGFLVGIPYLVFTLDIGKRTMLVVEGSRFQKRRTRTGKKISPVMGISYCFYKITYDVRYNQKIKKVVLYCEYVSSAEVLHRATQKVLYIQKQQKKYRKKAV